MSRGERRLAEAGGRATPTGRGTGLGTRSGSSGPHWPRTGHGTGSTGLAGAARHGGKHRDAGRHREERERLGRPGRSRAGNQCRFRASTGHHAPDYADYVRSAHPPRAPRPSCRDRIPGFCASATGLRPCVPPYLCVHPIFKTRGTKRKEERRKKEEKVTLASDRASSVQLWLTEVEIERSSCRSRRENCSPT